MIKYNNSNINDWYYDTSDIIKVYRNNAVCYYKIVTSGDTPTQVPCYAVVDNISQYSDTEFVDVFNKADEKWYKLNNLNQYEKYGVYGSGRTITYYEGKLTIDDGYEYIYSGNSWQDVGEISGSTILDNYVIPFEDSNVKSICVSNWGGNVIAGELTYGEAKQVTSLNSVFKNNTSITSFNELAYFNGLTALTDTEFVNCSNLKDIVIPNNVTNMVKRNGVSNSNALFKGCSNLSGLTFLSGGETLSIDLIFENSSYWMNSSHTSTPIIFPNRTMTFGSVFAYADYIRIGYFQSSTPPSGLSRSDITSSQRLGTIYCPIGSSSAYTAALNGLQKTVIEYDFDTDSNGILDKEKEWASKTSGTTTYPIYYDEKADPPNNLSFSSMTEAEEYECPWVGMKATIDGVKYVFSGDSQSGYEWVEDTNHNLPDVPFMLNYNAKNYNSSTYSIAKTEGQLKDVDAVCNYGYGIVDHSSDGYISVTSNTRMRLSGSTYLGRNNTQTGCTMTIVSKVKTSSGYSILTNRRYSGGYMNWMWRYPSNGIFLHGSTSYNKLLYFTTTTSTPIIASIKTYYDNGVKQQLNDWTNSGSYSGNFQYGTEYNGDSSLFCDYIDYNSEFWQGDFYWVYMSQNVLTDEQIQQVIDYNENL